MTKKGTTKAGLEKFSGEVALRQAIVGAATAMSERGLSPGRSGNISTRCGDDVLITPSGIAYDTLKPDAIVALRMDGAVRDHGSLTPSSEWRFHRDIYRARADVGAVVHTHSLYATALACSHRSIPAFHYMVAVAGGRDIPLVPYATFGTDALSGYVVDGLRKRNACLLANHGVVAVAQSVDAALALASEVETLAQMYCAALAIGEPTVLDDAEMAVVIAKFKTYGQPAKSDAMRKVAPGRG